MNFCIDCINCFGVKLTENCKYCGAKPRHVSKEEFDEMITSAWSDLHLDSQLYEAFEEDSEAFEQDSESAEEDSESAEEDSTAAEEDSRAAKQDSAAGAVPSQFWQNRTRDAEQDSMVVKTMPDLDGSGLLSLRGILELILTNPNILDTSPTMVSDLGATIKFHLPRHYEKIPHPSKANVFVRGYSAAEIVVIHSWLISADGQDFLQNYV
jgi:hypothetical protein